MYLINMGLVAHPNLPIPFSLQEYLKDYVEDYIEYKGLNLVFYHLEWVNKYPPLLNFIKENKEQCSFIIIGEENDDIEIYNQCDELPDLGFSREIVIIVNE